MSVGRWSIIRGMPGLGVPGVLARAAALLAAVAGLNLAVNPFDMYPSRWFVPLVLSTRHTKLQLFEARQPPPDLVVLGSSRSMTIDPAYILEKTGRNAFNAAVHGASPRDYVAFAHCLEAAPAFPRTVVIALGMEQLRGGSRLVEHHDALADCKPAEARPMSDALADLASLFTLDQTWASLRVLNLEIVGRPKPQFRFRDDGMVVEVRNQPLETALQASLDGNWSPGIFRFDAFDATPLDQVRQVLETCRRHGARAVVYLPPFHPRAIARYRAESRFVALRDGLLAQLEAWSREYPMSYYDLTEVERFGGSAAMFTDASHPSDEGGRRLVDALLPALR